MSPPTRLHRVVAAVNVAAYAAPRLNVAAYAAPRASGRVGFCVWSRRARELYPILRGGSGELRRAAVHRVRGTLVLRQRHHQICRRDRGHAARGRTRRWCPGRLGGPQQAAARRRDHRFPRRRTPGLDDLLLPVARIDRPRHRKAASCLPSSPIARTGPTKSSPPPSAQAVQAWRSRSRHPSSRLSKHWSVATTPVSTQKPNPVWRCRF